MEPTHPIEHRQLTDLERTLWRFRMVSHEAGVMLHGFRRYTNVVEAINDDLLFSLTHQALIIITKFLEVWDDFGSLAIKETRVVPTRKALTPFLDRILIWKGLDQFRNTALAHAYLTNDGKLMPPWELLKEGKAPTYVAEVILLLHLVHWAVRDILCVFEKEYLQIDSLAGPPTGQPSHEPGIEKGDEIDGELRKITGTVAADLKNTLGVTASGPIAHAFSKEIGN